MLSLKKPKIDFLQNGKKITYMSVTFRAIKDKEESHGAQDLPLPLNQVVKKFASEHNGEGEVTIVTGFLASLH